MFRLATPPDISERLCFVTLQNGYLLLIHPFMTEKQRQRLIAVAQSRIHFYETLLSNHIAEMYQEDIDRYLGLLAKAYEQVRTLEQETGEE